ncbi:hypothetical protein CCMA1212_001992 [Trichoderma ghanense]|uniref:Uncharacterized protein n=1 Tax=Trichoderma ghanense TaxID=65468 RepID=A0ABY2HDJ2_9HYPO
MKAIHAFPDAFKSREAWAGLASYSVRRGWRLPKVRVAVGPETRQSTVEKRNCSERYPDDGLLQLPSLPSRFDHSAAPTRAKGSTTLTSPTFVHWPLAGDRLQGHLPSSAPLT